MKVIMESEITQEAEQYLSEILTKKEISLFKAAYIDLVAHNMEKQQDWYQEICHPYRRFIKQIQDDCWKLQLAYKKLVESTKKDA